MNENEDRVNYWYNKISEFYSGAIKELKEQALKDFWLSLTTEEREFDVEEAMLLTISIGWYLSGENSDSFTFTEDEAIEATKNTIIISAFLNLIEDGQIVSNNEYCYNPYDIDNSLATFCMKDEENNIETIEDRLDNLL